MKTVSNSFRKVLMKLSTTEILVFDISKGNEILELTHSLKGLFFKMGGEENFNGKKLY